MIKAIFFDLDDTLIVHDELEMRVCKKIIEAIARKRRIDEGNASLIFFNFLSKYEGTPQWFDWRFISEYFDIDDVWRKAHIENLNLIKLHSDAKHVLKKLYKRFELGIMSNAICEVIEMKIEYLGIKKLFRYVLGSDSFNAIKSDINYFKMALNNFGISAEESAYVGDGYGRDTEIAKKAGMMSILVNRKNKSSDCNFRINDLREIYKILKIKD